MGKIAICLSCLGQDFYDIQYGESYPGITSQRQNHHLIQGGGNRYKYVFMGAQLLHGAGAAPLYTLGVTYIDENVGPENSAFYLGVFYTMAIIGPAVGYAMGGQFLNLHTDFARSVQIKKKNSIKRCKSVSPVKK